MEFLKYLSVGVTVFGAVVGALHWYSKSFTEQIARNAADLITLKQKTTIEEAVRSEFSKQTLTHQITTAEYARMRFTRLDELVRELYDLKGKAQGFLLLPILKTEEDFRLIGQEFIGSHVKANFVLNMAAMYIEDNIRLKTETFINECMAALGIAGDTYMFYRVMKEDSNTGDHEERKKTVKDYTDENKKLRAALAKLPELFIVLRSEYQKHLKEF